jgi:hypothetical protein
MSDKDNNKMDFENEPLSLDSPDNNNNNKGSSDAKSPSKYIRTTNGKSPRVDSDEGKGDSDEGKGDLMDQDSVASETVLKTYIKTKCPEIEGSTTFVSPYQLSDQSKYDFNFLKLMLEILDGSHDLACDKDQQNPLIDYSNAFLPDDLKIVLNDNSLQNYRSQTAIKNKMKEIIQNIPDNLNIALGRQKYSDSRFETIPKKLTELQTFLNDPNTKNEKSPKLTTAIIETHRGGMPVNKNPSDSTSQVRCNMFKSKLSTIFDLNASEQMAILEIGEIRNTFEECRLINNRLDIVRRFENPFPNSFSIFIKNIEILDLDSLSTILSGIKKTNNPDENYGSHAVEIFSIIQRNPQNFFRDSDVNTLYLLHMFTDIETGTPTFSLQKDAVTADQVTTALFGIKKRNCLSFSKVKPLTQSLLLLSRMSKKTEDCHIIYAKTCGDGVAIFIVRIFSYLVGNTVGLLSSDVCCNYRNLLENGYSIRQLPTKLAGTGLGFMATERQIEIYKNVEINAPSILGNIDKIVTNYNINTVMILNDCIDYFNNQYLDRIDVEKFKEKQNSYLNKFINSIKYIYFMDGDYKDFLNNSYNANIFEIAIYHFAVIVFKNIDNINNKYKKTLYMFSEKSGKDLFVKVRSKRKSTNDDDDNDDDVDCEEVKNVCSSPILIYSAEEQISSLLKEFLVKFINLTSIKDKFKDNITLPRDDNEMNEKIENNIKIISSIENLFETIITSHDDIGYHDTIIKFVKVHVLFNLVIIMQKVGDRVIDKYVTNIIEKIKKFKQNSEGYDKKFDEVMRQNHPNINFECLDFNQQYKVIVNAFNQYYSVSQREKTKYLERQELKQLINLLKYILREIKAKNYEDVIKGNEVSFPNLFDNYDKITCQVESPENSPFSQGGATLRPSMFTELPNSDSDSDSDDNDSYTTPNNNNNNNPRQICDSLNEEDLSTVLSPLDDNVINRHDMDENEVEDFYRENDLDSTLPKNYDYLNLSKMIAKCISNPIIDDTEGLNLDPSIIFDYIIAQRTKRGDDNDNLLKNGEKALSSINDILVNNLKNIVNEVEGINNTTNALNDNKSTSKQDYYEDFDFDYKDGEDSDKYTYKTLHVEGPRTVYETFSKVYYKDDLILDGNYGVVEYNYTKKYLNDDDDKAVTIKVTNYYPDPNDGKRKPASIREINIPGKTDPIIEVSSIGTLFMYGGKKHKKTRKFKKKKRNTIRNK